SRGSAGGFPSFGDSQTFRVTMVPSMTQTLTDPALADELVATVRNFVQRDVLPVADGLEHADEYPTALVERMADLGLFGCRISPDHGGLGLDTVTYARLVEELAAGWMSLTGVLNTH